MGCASSKRVEATVDVYKPAPTSFAVFDINAIEEPWIKEADETAQPDEKTPHVPAPILDKLNAIEDAPRTWDEVSKALEDLKPKLNSSPAPASPVQASEALAKKAPRKSFSFHTLEELDAKNPAQLRKTESMRTGLKQNEAVKPDQLKKLEARKSEPRAEIAEPRNGSQTEGFSHGRSVKDNIFIVKDRLEREKEGKTPIFVQRDPLSDFEEKCPPNGADAVVLYTTSLGGIRRTFEDCNRVRAILETHQLVFDERDISLHGEFRKELRELLGEEASVPMLFVKGRHVGGADQVVGLNETGRLGRILKWTRVERGVGRMGCEGCGGARFVPCLDCGGSCKVLVGDSKERCGVCNENGLVHCPLCI